MAPVKQQATMIAALKALGQINAKADDVAGAMLAAVKQAEIKNLTEFSESIAAGYAANGWRYGAGKPTAESAKLQPAPRTVRNYVWEFRVAFGLGVKVHKMDSLYTMRQAVMNARKAQIASRLPQAANDPSAGPLPELKGVVVREAGTLNGGMFHDLAVAYGHLPPTDREAMLAALRRILTRYQRQVDGTLRAVG